VVEDIQLQQGSFSGCLSLQCFVWSSKGHNCIGE